MHATLPLLRASDFPPIRRRKLETLQVNLGYRCNQCCTHCHVTPGRTAPKRCHGTTSTLCSPSSARHRVATLDLTGGAPELQPALSSLIVSRARALRRARHRSLQPDDPRGARAGGPGGVPRRARRRDRRVAALLSRGQRRPPARRGRVRGQHRGLRALNALGYGRAGRGLVLNLVYNPQGASLPPPQAALEADYKRELRARLRHRLQPAVHADQHADPALRQHARLQGTVRRYMAAAAQRLPGTQPRRR